MPCSPRVMSAASQLQPPQDRLPGREHVRLACGCARPSPARPRPGSASRGPRGDRGAKCATFGSTSTGTPRRRARARTVFIDRGGDHALLVVGQDRPRPQEGRAARTRCEQRALQGARHRRRGLAVRPHDLLVVGDDARLHRGRAGRRRRRSARPRLRPRPGPCARAGPAASSPMTPATTACAAERAHVAGHVGGAAQVEASPMRSPPRARAPPARCGPPCPTGTRRASRRRAPARGRRASP